MTVLQADQQVVCEPIVTYNRLRKQKIVGAVPQPAGQEGTADMVPYRQGMLTMGCGFLCKGSLMQHAATCCNMTALVQ